MPSARNYPCSSCNFIGKNRKVLATHVAINHSSKIYRCVLCSFVTQYQANFYRHRRVVHNLGRSTVCDVCSAEVSDTNELISHTSEYHPESLERLFRCLKAQKARSGGSGGESSRNISRSSPEESASAVKSFLEQGKNEENVDAGASTEEPPAKKIKLSPNNKISSGRRNPLRRNYICEECNFKTLLPAEYLAHRRDVHMEKLKIYRCPLCVYASKNPYKVIRHCNFIHKESSDDPLVKNLKAGTSSGSNKIKAPEVNKSAEVDKALLPVVRAIKLPLEIEKGRPVIAKKDKFHKCSYCSFQARSKVLVCEHEKTSHLKKKFFRCLQCGYACNERPRYLRHLKYHDLPKVKCQYCDFKTAYTWNMQRHLKNHTSEGNLQCDKCDFKTMSRQSLTVHTSNHHGIHEGNDVDQEEHIDVVTVENEEDSEFSLNEQLQNTQDEDSDTAIIKNKSSTPKLKVIKNSQKSRRCRYCPHRTNWPSEMKKHEATHFKPCKKHACPLCEVRFDSLDHLNRHLSKMHYQLQQSENVSDSSQEESEKVDYGSDDDDDDDGKAAESKANSFSSVSSSDSKDKLPHVCKVCGYRTRWISELKKHELVHEKGKPFCCRYCTYQTKWKGDMTRHVFRHHKDIVSEVGDPTKVYQYVKPSNNSEILRKHLLSFKPNKSQIQAQGRNTASGKSDGIQGEQDIPLDLTTPQITESLLHDRLLGEQKQSSLMNISLMKNPSILNKVLAKKVVKKYKCPQCSFLTRTACRFHVHMIQHLNKKPYMCSVCNYRSNWQWDVNKHIKTKLNFSEDHASADVLIMDEMGQKNYSRYKVYLVDVEEESDESAESSSKDNQASVIEVEGPSENIVVTPDIYSDSGLVPVSDSGSLPQASIQQKQYQQLFCGHCSFSHNERKVIISHLGVHAGVKPYRCRICGFLSKWYHIVLMHAKHKHNGISKDIESRISFKQEGPVFKLVEMDSSTKTTSQQEEDAFKCNMCPYTCNKLCYMEFHMKQHTPREGAIYKCNSCPYYVKFKKTLIRHVKLHDGISTYGRHQDHLLEKKDGEQPSEATDSSMQENTKKDPNSSPTKRHVCEHCPYNSDNKTQFLYHKQFHRPNKNAPFKCETCSYWSTHQHLITQHQRVHKMSNPSFSSKPVVVSSAGTDNSKDKIPLMNVMVDGVLTKMFKCRFCPLMNKRRANVKVHEKMHLGKNTSRFQCMLCSYRCNNTGVLASHMKVHKGQEAMETSVSEVPSESPKPAQPALVLPVASPSSKRKFFSYFCDSCPGMFKSTSDLETHKVYHNSSFPHPCHLCNYRARTKPHLHKHLLVHTPEYALRQQGKTLAELRGEMDRGNIEALNVPPRQTSLDQLLLIEERETRAFLDNQNAAVSQRLYRCSVCPASFQNSTTLSYHETLHGSAGLYACHFCNYAANNSANVSAHTQLHYRGAIRQKAPPRVFTCDKCPATFTKTLRLENHKKLHGQGNRYKCPYCDYSVRFAANIVKHKRVHVTSSPSVGPPPEPEPQNTDVASSSNSIQVESEISALTASPEKAVVVPEERRLFSCSHCPYTFHRKDTVLNHMKRHGSKEGMTCSYCDYSTLSACFLRDHIKLHFQENKIKPEAYMKCEAYKIWTYLEGEKFLLFQDSGPDHETGRYYPTEDDELQFMDNLGKNYNENPEDGDDSTIIDPLSEGAEDLDDVTESESKSLISAAINEEEIPHPEVFVHIKEEYEDDSIICEPVVDDDHIQFSNPIQVPNENVCPNEDDKESDSLPSKTIVRQQILGDLCSIENIAYKDCKSGNTVSDEKSECEPQTGSKETDVVVQYAEEGYFESSTYMEEVEVSSADEETQDEIAQSDTSQVIISVEDSKEKVSGEMMQVKFAEVSDGMVHIDHENQEPSQSEPDSCKQGENVDISEPERRMSGEFEPISTVMTQNTGEVEQSENKHNELPELSNGLELNELQNETEDQDVTDFKSQNEVEMQEMIEDESLNEEIHEEVMEVVDSSVEENSEIVSSEEKIDIVNLNELLHTENTNVIQIITTVEDPNEHSEFIVQTDSELSLEEECLDTSRMPENYREVSDSEVATAVESLCENVTVSIDEVQERYICENGQLLTTNELYQESSDKSEDSQDRDGAESIEGSQISYIHGINQELILISEDSEIVGGNTETLVFTHEPEIISQEATEVTDKEIIITSHENLQPGD